MECAQHNLKTCFPGSRMCPVIKAPSVPGPCASWNIFLSVSTSVAIEKSTWEIHGLDGECTLLWLIKRKIPSLHTHRNLTSCPSSSCAPAVGELRSALQEHWQLPRQAGPAPPLCPFARSGAGGGVQVRVLSPVS